MIRSSGSASRIRSSPLVAAASAMKLATSMWSGQIRCSAPPSLSRPCTVITFEPMPSICAPILTSRRARSWTWGSQAAFAIVVGPAVSAAAISAFSVAITEGSSMKIPQGFEAAVRRRDLDPALALDQGAHVAEGVEVRVEAPPADEVAARRRHPRLAEARQQRAGEQERGADPRGQLLVDLGVRDGVGLEAKLVVAAPVGLHAEPLEQGDLGLGVADPRHVGEHELLVGEQAGGDDRQRRVLVPGGDDLARERAAALDDELLHRCGDGHQVRG